MRDNIRGILWTIAICAVVVAVVFGLLGALIGLDFAVVIAAVAAQAFALAIYLTAAMWVIGFDWSDMPFFKATGGSVLMAVLSYLVFDFFEWAVFYTLMIIFAVCAAVAVVIGVIKTIFT